MPPHLQLLVLHGLIDAPLEKILVAFHLLDFLEVKRALVDELLELSHQLLGQALVTGSGVHADMDHTLPGSAASPELVASLGQGGNQRRGGAPRAQPHVGTVEVISAA